jgi:hypothetical protein
MLAWGAAIKAFTLFGLNSLEWAGLAHHHLHHLLLRHRAHLKVIYNTWLGYRSLC